MNKTGKIIDLRSDTVTKPTEPMRRAMYEAEVGDDVLGDDPTVKQLEEKICSLLGTESAIFVPSGTQANLLSIMSHCERGDEYISGQGAHCYNHEGGGAAVLGSVQPQPLEFLPDGTLDLDEVEKKIKPDDFHFARTRLLCLENTQDGKALPPDYLRKASSFCARHGLGIHLDGARLFNAAVSCGIDAREIARHFDTVSVCLSKGLGAPVGSLVCGKKQNVDKARRWRKVLGGGMRQVGILAAAGLYALENNIERLAKDHANAALLASMLTGISQVKIRYQATNMVFLDVPESCGTALAGFMKQRGILIFPGSSQRLVTHLGITEEDARIAAGAFIEYFGS